MAGTIKGITIEIGGNTTKLTEALKAVDKEIRGTQKDLKELDKLLKIDPGNTELLTRKQKALTDAIEATKTKLNDEKTALEQLKNAPQTELTKKQQEALTLEIIKTEQSLKSLQEEYKAFGSVVAQQLEVAGAKMQKIGSGISGAGKALAPVSAVLTGLGTAAVKITADFDGQMSKVKAISNATGEEFDALRDKAREMGAKTKFSATESAQAMEYMAMAGWKTGDMLSGIEGIMNLAAASGEELATTSDIVTDSLTAFGLKASDSGHFADVLAAASTNANTNVSLLGESFKYVASTAGAFKFSTEDTVLALSLMANAGIKGSHAGESLKNALVNLIKPTKKQTEAMAQLGFISTETFQKIDTAKVEKAQNRVTEATLNLSTAQAKYNVVLQKYSVNSPQAIAAHNNLEKAQLKLKTAQAELEKQQQGVSEQIRGQNTLMTNADGSTKSLKEIMDTLRSTLGNVSVALTDAQGNTRDFDDIVNELASSEDTLTQAQQLQYAATLFGKQNMSGMLAVLTATDEDYQKLTKAIYNCDDTAKNMSDTMQDNLNGQLTKLMSALQELAIQIGDALMPIVRAVVEKIQSWVEWLQQMDEGTRNTILAVGAFVAALAPVLIITGQLVTAVGAITSALGTFAGFMSTTAIPAIGSITSALGTFISFMSATAIPAIGAFLAAWGPVIAIIAVVGAAIAGLILIFKNWGDICEWFGELWEDICSDTKSAWDTICNVVEFGIKLIASILDAAFQIVTLPFAFIWENCKETVQSAGEKICNGISETMTLIGGLMQKSCNAIKTVISPIVDGVCGYISDKGEALKESVSSITDSISEYVSSKWDAIKDYTAGVWTQTKDYVLGIWDSIKDGVSSKIQGMWDSVKNMFSGIWQTVSNIIQRIKDCFSFDWKLPKIKLPHFKIKGSFSLAPPSVPHLSIEWYRKAMDDAYILNSPTIFGASGGNLLGGGEAGQEAIVGTDKLGAIVREAITSVMGGGTTVIPVYIGQERIEEIVVRANKSVNYRSGGR